MIRHETTKEDLDDPRMNPPAWMLEILKCNPGYVSWGNFEDYMMGGKAQWNSPLEIESASELWELDDLNECANFYFTIDRTTATCPSCDGNGLNKEAAKIADSFYSHMDPAGVGWCNDITQEESDALYDKGRLRDFKERPTASQVNEWNRNNFGHDAINRFILVEARCKRLGIEYGRCSTCDGHGYVFTEDHERLALQLWMLHPRKGCSRGVYIRSVSQEDLPSIKKWLAQARERNHERFAGIELLTDAVTT